MAQRRVLVAMLLLGLLLGTWLARGSAVAAPGGSTPVPHYHSVPCVRTMPDTVAVTWKIVRSTIAPHSKTGKAVRHVTAGRRTIRSISVAHSLYHQVCEAVLIKYNQPVSTACPAAVGSADYHLLFTGGTRVLLGVTESDFGCQTVWIDRHRNLGYAFQVLYLPAGVPTLVARQ